MAEKRDVESIFYNADYVVIEYIDLLKSPYLLLLHALIQNEAIHEILNIDEISFLDDAGLYEWYINRKHQNFLIDLNKYPDKISDEQMDMLLESQISSTAYFYNQALPLNLINMLISMKKEKMAKGIIIYHPHKNDFAKKDLDTFLDEKYEFMTDFNEVMEKAGYNSTYFLSDINKMNMLKDKGILAMSSITLPLEYRYNKKNMDDFSLDLEALYKENPYKLTFYRACTEEVKVQPSEEIKDIMREEDEMIDFNHLNIFELQRELDEKMSKYEEESESGI